MEQPLYFLFRMKRTNVYNTTVGQTSCVTSCQESVNDKVLRHWI